MVKLTIKARIILAVTLFFAVMLIGFAHLIYRSARNGEIAQLDARLENHATKIQAELDVESDDLVRPEMGELRSIYTDGLDEVRLQLFDSLGVVVIADSLLGGQPAEFLTAALAGHTLKTKLEAGHRRFRGLWVPVEVNDKPQGALEIAAPMDGIAASLRHLWILFLVTIPCVLLLTALAVYWIVTMAFRPMTAMIETAGRITANNLDQRLTLPGTADEIRKLGETLNSMIARIGDAFKSQRQFVADASHEIRTPLTVISSELEYSVRNTKDELTKTSLETMLSEIDRLANLVEGLLLLARLDASALQLNLQTIRLDELVAESIQLVAPLAAKKQIRIRFQVKQPVEIKADHEKLKRTFVNLLDNAIKYSSAGSVIPVSLRVGNTRPNLALVSIEDHGSGIAAADLPNIFKRFYRAATSRADDSGSGLGLAIADQLVSLHHGEITVSSRLGEGSTIIVKLPIERAIQF